MPKRSDHARIMAMLAGYPDKDVLAMAEEQGDADDVGDTLFQFMYRECHDSGCDESEFLRMCGKAIKDIEAVMTHLEMG